MDTQHLALVALAAGVVGLILGAWWTGVVASKALAAAHQDTATMVQHLEAIGGDEAVRVALGGRTPPSASAALRMAEDRYLERSGWTRDIRDPGKWRPSWDPLLWSHERALERQRWRDGVPAGAVDALRRA